MPIARLGKYELLEKLGEGAMGEVFRAKDPVLGREVAVKIIGSRLGTDTVARQRFLREARACAQLNHPNIVIIHDFGDEQGVAYMAMELLEGTDLRTLIEGRQITDMQEKLLAMDQILDGMAFAHQRGLVHRDLKPGNIRLLPNMQVKIMDFGLARQAEDADTHGEVVMGTPYYIAPELGEGQPATKRSDVFSLGVLFYELLAGKRPFTGATVAAVLHAVANDRPEPLAKAAPELPRGIAAIVERALAKRPPGRYADAGEMLTALRVAWQGALPAAPARADGAPVDDTPARDLGPPPSSRPDTTPEMRDALEEVEQFLGDRLPPLMAWESITELTRMPPAAAAAQLWDWAKRQHAVREHPLIDLLFHALQRLSVMGDLDLLEKKGLIAVLRATGLELAAALPPGDGERLRAALSRLGESELSRPASIENVRGLGDSGALVLPPTPGLKRLSLLEQRLRRLNAAGPAAHVAQQRAVSEAITLAAMEARNGPELNQQLHRLQAFGVPSGPEQVFRSLGQQLTDWALPPKLDDTADLGPARELKAMAQIVVLAEDPVEAARRYHHLVSAAVEQFNAGNLGGAVEMLDVAARLAAEEKVPSGYTTPVLAHGHNALDPARLREYLEKPQRHRQLRSMMRVFEAGLGAPTLLDEVEREQKRDRRRLLLDLLLVHGENARAVAATRLMASLATPANDFARRNWIYLLRTVPRPQNVEPEPEIDAVSQFATPKNPIFLVKEGLTFLGHDRHPRAIEALVALLAVWERELEGAPIDPAAREGPLAALDRVAAALARHTGSAAWRPLVEHGLSRRPELGATLDRLAELGRQDLSSAPGVVDALVERVRETIPRGRIDALFRRRKRELPALVAALSGTRTPAVRSLLRDVAKRLPADEAGRAAMDALVPARAPAAAAAALSGEYDTRALPQLFERLAAASASGTLELRPVEAGAPCASLGFVEGQIVSAQWAHREGLDAVYQLFERPFTGRYAFDAANKPAARRPLDELRPIVREGVRRARELRQLCAMVPEDSPLEPTGAPPGTVLEEPEYDLVVTLWQRSCAGVSPAQLEAELEADVYRILRPLAQWMEEGALVAARAATEPEAPAGAAPA